MSPAGFAVVAGLLALQRLAELALSARHLSRLPAAGRQAPCADTPARWRAMVALHSALLTLPAAEAAWRGQLAPAPLLWSALAALAAAGALRVWTMAALGPAWNARGIVPADLVLVTGGPYRFVRHPNYLAVLVEFAALPLAAGAWFSLALLGPGAWWITAKRMASEESLLAERPGWTATLARRPRLIPRLARMP